ncbi:hypothetical protein SASPL_103459 [Salvia splendens]|uniref:Protein kinase domain-containing protein n=1 Tax=Salvia splendens TaxID=180675 RepID=A0A8X8YFU3_SALSN|nr:hypothetical protein SASPL_103459 [Salvia splendens]
MPCNRRRSRSTPPADTTTGFRRAPWCTTRRGIVEERLIAGGFDAVEGGPRHGGLELRARGDVHAPAGDPRRLEAAAEAEVDAGDVLPGERLVGVPARLGGVERGVEGAGEAKVVSEDEAEALQDVLALETSVEIRAFGDRSQTPQKFEVERASGGNGYLIGKGGYAEVYRGRLRGGQLVAIKRLTKGGMEERIADFLTELGIMGHLNHPNTDKLVGYGVEGGVYLVLDICMNLEYTFRLFCHETDPRENVEWSTRYKVALGTAKGLLYLHEGCQRRIIHRDIKAANILLTEDFEHLKL